MKLPIGKARYGVMLREDGIVMDDGTTARMSENHFIMTTTTINAESVYRHLEFCHQCLWPDMDVRLISITDAWAQIAIAGPKSRKAMSCHVNNAVSQAVLSVVKFDTEGAVANEVEAACRLSTFVL